jgi:hypothetical protein
MLYYGYPMQCLVVYIVNQSAPEIRVNLLCKYRMFVVLSTQKGQV